MRTPRAKFHVFICYVNEDKHDIVEPLYHQLRRRGLKVWYDDQQIGVGDSIREKIDAGLRDSSFGVVILSKSFFKKKWSNYELDGLLAKETKKGRAILPVWHKVGYRDVKKYSLSLANRRALDTRYGVASVATGVAAKIIPEISKSEGGRHKQTLSLQRLVLKNKLMPSYKPRIIIIDDDEKVPWILQEGLESEFDFLWARDGLEGLQMIAAEPPDLVLLDLKMPGMSGLEVLKRLRKSKQKVDVVMVSGHGETRDIVDAIKLGAIDWFDKPFDVREAGIRIWNAIRYRLLSD
jgi:CheY-like chemotaxis protein